MRLKPGVKLTNLSPQITLAAVIAYGVYREHDTEFVITSCNDGKHKEDSFHYKGNAIDIRTKNFFGDKHALRLEIAQRLGTDFDVLFEGEGTESEHLHLEYDV